VSLILVGVQNDTENDAAGIERGRPMRQWLAFKERVEDFDQLLALAACS
jgi:hypothetical protein